MISERSMQILLGRISEDMPESEWSELDRILCGEGSDGEMQEYWRNTKAAAAGLSQAARCARARRIFVATLAEWTQMHDFHAPFAQGPPNKGQSCAKVDNEHSTSERVACDNFFHGSLFNLVRRRCRRTRGVENFTGCGWAEIAISSTIIFPLSRLHYLRIWTSRQPSPNLGLSNT